MPKKTFSISSFLLALCPPLSADASLLDGDPVSAPIPFDVSDVSNLPQLTQDSPSTVTVLKSDLLFKLGITEFIDAMRLVPGMTSTISTSRLRFSQYHGGNGLKNRMGYSLNGHDLTQNFRHQDLQDQFNMREISKITVSRSSGGANFGDLAFVAHVNIDTKPINASDEFSASMFFGSRDTQMVNISQKKAINDHLSFGIGTAYHHDDGLDYKTDQEKLIDYNRNSRISTELKGIYDKTIFDISATAIGLKKGATISYTGQHGLSESFTSNPNFSSSYNRDEPVQKLKYGLFANLTHSINTDFIFKFSSSAQHFEASHEFRICNNSRFFSPEMGELSKINSDLAKKLVAVDADSIDIDHLNLTPTERQSVQRYLTEQSSLGIKNDSVMCYITNNNIDIKRYQSKVSVEFSMLDNVRIIAGFSGYIEKYISDTYFNGRVNNKGGKIFLQSEYTTDKITLNYAANFEAGDSFEKSVIAMKASVNWHITPLSTLRLTYSEGYRTPDLIETDRSWGYKGVVLGDNPYGSNQVSYYYRSINTNDQLESEVIHSYAASYFGHIDDFIIDFKVFYDKLDNLINDNLSFYRDAALANTVSNIQYGYEFNVTYKATPSLDFGLIYAWIETDTNAESEKAFSVQHQGSAYAIYGLGDNTSIALAYYANSEIRKQQYGRFDLTITSELYSTERAVFESQFQYKYLLNRDVAMNPLYFEKEGETYASYGSKNYFMAGFLLTF